VTAQVVVSLGEHGVEPAALDVQRHQHGRVGASPYIERQRLFGAEEHAT
jgi:hypothetical protein